MKKSILYFMLVALFLMSCGANAQQKRKIRNPKKITTVEQVPINPDLKLGIIRGTGVTCPEGYVLLNGNCARTVIIQGKLVFIACVGGRMQYNEVVDNGNGDGVAGETVTGPQTGESCNGNWVHTTNIKD